MEEFAMKTVPKWRVLLCVLAIIAVVALVMVIVINSNDQGSSNVTPPDNQDNQDNQGNQGAVISMTVSGGVVGDLSSYTSINGLVTLGDD